LNDIESGNLDFSAGGEDIHMFIEAELSKRIGDNGKRLHTARSRNDQVALDVKIYIKNKILEIKDLLSSLLSTIYKLANENQDTVMPGFTHLQHAQPITFSHHLLAYAQMFCRDVSRLQNTLERSDVMPLGSGALASTTYNIDREYVANKLGFSSITLNSLDGVSDRDSVIELNYDISMIMMHLSRFAEEITVWCSTEYSFIELDDAFSTGSSIMPQKKNPDIAELVRGKTGRTYGNLMAILTVMKGLPLAYNKDMQEDKELLFDSVDTVKSCIEIFDKMLATLKPNKQIMQKSARKGFLNATDCADYLTKKKMPFRDAYKITGELVAYCIEKSCSLEELSLAEFKNFSPAFESDVYDALKLINCVERRDCVGGPGKTSTKIQLENLKKIIDNI